MNFKKVGFCLLSKTDLTISPTFTSFSMHLTAWGKKKSNQQVLQMQYYTSIPISNPPPRPAIPIAEGADQAVKQNKNYRSITTHYKKCSSNYYSSKLLRTLFITTRMQSYKDTSLFQ